MFDNFKIRVIEEDDFAITVTMPTVEGADFAPSLKLELVLQPVTPDSDTTFLETADLSDDVPGAGDYGLAALQAQTRYPDVDMTQIVTLRTLPELDLSISRRSGRCVGRGNPHHVCPAHGFNARGAKRSIRLPPGMLGRFYPMGGKQVT